MLLNLIALNTGKSYMTGEDCIIAKNKKLRTIIKKELWRTILIKVITIEYNRKKIYM